MLEDGADNNGYITSTSSCLVKEVNELDDEG